MTTACAKPSCKATHPDHHWGGVRAHAKGWFAQKDGTVWCPEHTPDWVAEWRRKCATS